MKDKVKVLRNGDWTFVSPSNIFVGDTIQMQFRLYQVQSVPIYDTVQCSWCANLTPVEYKKIG